MIKNDTIAAIATPPGEGSIAIVRVSGPEAIQITDKIFSGSVPSFSSHTAHLGTVSYNGQQIDQTLLLIMRAPRSFTGEDVIELQCHGGYFSCSQILAALIAEGARPALPGEFSQRAFLNGKIDLIQAEAIQNIIAADSLDAFHIAQNHFQGHFSKKVQQISSLIIESLAFIEVLADFPEEEQPDMEEPLHRLNEAILIIEDLIASFDQGQKIAQGTSIILAGHPNAGKSSLLNALTNKNRAIVTDIPGTTRDILEETWMLQGKRIRLIDSAGQRETNNPIEQEGIERALAAMEESEAILWVMDVTQPPPPLPEILMRKPSLLLWNKSDLGTPPHIETTLPQLAVSAKTGEGIFELKQFIQKWMQKQQLGKNAKVFLVSSRHHTILQQMRTYLLSAQEGLQHQFPPEFIALELRQALQTTGNLSGSEINETILGEIFSRFCIGK
ncbi:MULTISPECIES: tRNA uridine-5-carboxymethylaminomethyl(34) synthesis GTPase MnmE [Chlamydia]|uniref:tRNA modification GTPase MnmE n=2 Tax=Chlamydia TaxID=810 RepID=A0ABN0MQ97_CHLPS|nr:MULTISPECIES: tRNA uridine-5-carboxymethylaminomethyl(34) synthesis GTPase MnmE [Chlamydia]AFS23194.1 tRNA modification GTPase TrmE [Chlamydia psittaci VS225]AGE75504.1 tRNA modification GTPase TrmE [Chlamydia psittaci Mat116]EPJ33068.1 tRNA modification GTPase TrmE [Chlamydia psittaci 06-1683]EPP31085.1 tRNA modification GTPase TrmE [Chlamydia psittaci C1/97]AFS21060.1 tRNA modification GTPase TrmE [Chlamydia psittaci GR9]